MGSNKESVLARRAGVLVIAVLIITMAFITILPKVKIDMEFKKFMPESEVVTAYDDMVEYFGEEETYFYILVESQSDPGNILTPNALREQYIVADEAMNHEGVIDVYSLGLIIDELVRMNFDSTITETDDATINLILDTFQAIALGKINITGYSSSELTALADIILSKDFDLTADELSAKSTVILVSLDQSLSTSELKDLSKELRDDLENVGVAELELSYTGNHLVTSDIDRIGNEYVIWLGIAIVILVTLVLAFTFRRVSYVVLPMSTLAIAIIWTLGTMTLLGIKFTLIDIAVIPLLLGLGVDYTVHSSRRYQSECDKADSEFTAMKQAQRRIVPAIFLAVLTTSIAFLSNLLSSIQPIREFGLICAIGIFYAFILTLMFHNTSRVLVDRFTKQKKSKQAAKAPEETEMVKIAIRTASQSVKWFPVLAIVMVAVITSLAFVGAVNVRTEFGETDFLPEDWASIETSQKINDNFEAGRYSEVYVFIRDELSVPQNIATVQMLEQFSEFESALHDNDYVVKLNGEPRIESPLLYVQRFLRTNATFQAMYDTDTDLMPDDSAAVVAIYDFLMEYDEIADPLSGQTYSERMRTLLHRDEDGNYDAAKISIFVNAETTGEIETLYEGLEADLPDFLETSVVITGNTIMTIVTVDALQSGQINSTVVAIILAFILLVILYRSIGLGLISMVPVVLSTLWILGTMYFFGISLNVLTVMVTALTIGLGLDYAIYIVSRYQEERKERSIQEAIDATIKGTGSALFISAVTTVCGFAVLLISPIPIIAHFGLIIATTIIFCGVLAVVVLPILLGGWEKMKSDRD